MAVVIATRDTRELTLKCLDSVAAAHVTPEQVILVDDGSRDGTAAAVAERHPAVRVLRNDDSRGFSAAANCGLRAARSPLLLLLNSDTELAPDALPALAGAFRDDDRLGVAGAVLSNPDGTEQWSGGSAPTTVWLFAVASGLGRVRRKLTPIRATRQAARHVDWVTGAALAMRRSVWRECGPLDESFAFYCQDLDLCLRAGRAGWNVRLVADCRVTHHLGATISRCAGSTTDVESLWADLVRWAAKNGGSVKARRAARALRLGGLVRSLGLTAALALTRGRRGHQILGQLATVRQARRAVRRTLETIPV